ncbi:hypothetical protein HRbin12_01460 [bacterium HR12]|nr:hypothetical protein HRbin12_01460 [bacterium HR12]
MYEAWAGARLREPIEVLGRLREAAPTEPVPEIRTGTPGIWMLWEIRPHGTAGLRDCYALFVTEDGAIRPDLAERLWLLLSRADRVEAGPPLSPGEWERLMALGADHAYAACSRLAPPDTWRAPWLIPRLVVRSVA